LGSHLLTEKANKIPSAQCPNIYEALSVQERPIL
jgi:hypothetical protein